MKEKLSAGTAKLTKAAKLRKSDTQLMKLSNAAVEEREARNRGGEPSLNRLQIGAHIGILFFTFLSICLMAAVAAFQAKWIKVCEYYRRGPSADSPCADANSRRGGILALHPSVQLCARCMLARDPACV